MLTQRQISISAVIAERLSFHRRKQQEDRSVWLAHAHAEEVAQQMAYEFAEILFEQREDRVAFLDRCGVAS